jgi:hypothetical protein
MPIQFNRDSETGILFTRAEGLLSFEDLQRHLDEEVASKGAGYAEIFDASDASTNLTSAQIKQIADRVTSMMQVDPFGATAIIANKDAVFGMARMLETFCELESGPPMGVFRTVDEGLKWLQTQMPAGKKNIPAAIPEERGSARAAASRP